ncbi:MAG: DUF2769 domain-containing protein [Methanomicrobiaceae archaeon]|nr:DUF2769 domain-containing protein [Methanomicrobiaceae archaeon]
MDMQTYQDLMLAVDLSKDEKKLILEKRQKQCLCRQCPTYMECSGEEASVFCTIGKSNCITREIECLCPTCPFAAEFGLKNTFFCTRGSEKQQLLVETLQVRKTWVE